LITYIIDILSTDVGKHQTWRIGTGSDERNNFYGDRVGFVV